MSEKEMIVNNLEKMKETYSLDKLLFSNELFETSMNKTFNLKGSVGNATEFHNYNFPIILLEISREISYSNDQEFLEGNINKFKLFKQMNIYPYCTYLYKKENFRNKISTPVIESEECFIELNETMKELNYLISNVYSLFNDVLILKVGKHKDFDLLFSMLFSSGIKASMIVESIKQIVKLTSNGISNEAKKLKKLIEKAAS